MSTPPAREPKNGPATPGSRLSVRPEGDGPAEVRFLFEQPDSRRLGFGFGFGFVAHLVALGLLLRVVALMPERVYEAVIPERLSTEIVWLPDPGPGGGGGGGNQMEEPPQEAELPGEEVITVPTEPEPIPDPTPEPEPEPEPVETLSIAALNTASAATTTFGGIESSQASSSLGPGTGGGVGPGEGDGLGPGEGGNTGGGVARPGNGVLEPKLLRQVKPQYTADAMRAKVQGVVWLDCVVLPDGTVGNIDVVRSLDPVFGLDQEAVKAARQWRFEPGTRNGEPVAVLVTIELTFTLR
jgi:protein TonB